MNRKPKMTPRMEDWKTHYRDQILSSHDAVKAVKPGHRVFLGTGCAQPNSLVQSLTDRHAELNDVELIQLFTMGEAPYADKKMIDHFKVNTFFVSRNVRNLVKEGFGSYTPIFLSDIPKLFASGEMPIDVSLIQVSPPDERGMCSLGVSVDIVRAAVENSRLVIAEVNEQMPRTHGDSLINIYDLDHLVPVNSPLIEYDSQEPTQESQKIGEYIAALVESGSTVELGIGLIPQASLDHFKGKSNLGIHTEMLSDSIIDLIESGVVNGSRKSMDPGKVVASFCMGTKKLYEYIDDNPMFSFRPTEYVNDPFTIARQTKMVAINTSMEVDLTGQVCADSVGPKFYSGIGGQVDFNRGATQSPGGKAIIALPSTANNGEVSRIVTHLSPGSGVVTTRGDVHYVVTEYGTAYLHGKSIQGRALALISISHPKFRAQLIKEAIEAKYLMPDMAAVQGKMFVEPPGLRASMIMEDGTPIKFRPIHPTDEPRMRELFYALSESTIYYRFGSHMKKLPQKQIQDFVYIDHRNEVSIVGTIPEAHGEEIVAMGCYYLDTKNNRAEVALVTRDPWQNRGIGTFLLKTLARIARRNGIRGLTAQIHFQNKIMQNLMYKIGAKVKSELKDGVYGITVDF